MHTWACSSKKLKVCMSGYFLRLGIWFQGINKKWRIADDKIIFLIVSNPPFYINSLKSDTQAKEIARHTDLQFFEDMLRCASDHLTENGSLQLILPINMADLVRIKASDYDLIGCLSFNIKSYSHSEPHRQIIKIHRSEEKYESQELVIYDAQKV